MTSLTRLSRPLRRLLDRPAGRLVITLTPDGLVLRGYRRRAGRLISWARIASLADEHAPILTHCEAADGERRLAALAE